MQGLCNNDCLDNNLPTNLKVRDFYKIMLVNLRIFDCVTFPISVLSSYKMELLKILDSRVDNDGNITKRISVFKIEIPNENWLLAICNINKSTKLVKVQVLFNSSNMSEGMYSSDDIYRYYIEHRKLYFDF